MRANVPRDPRDVDLLLQNARLRDELEPFYDESIALLNQGELPMQEENEYLASMLAWERAPVVPIAQWFEPELRLAPPAAVDDRDLAELLQRVVERLFRKRVVLDFTDHLSDRQLYTLIYRDILPAPEKKLNRTNAYLHWDCAGVADNPEVWLRYYASEEERQAWAEVNDQPLPATEALPYPRKLPRRPL